MSQTVWVLSCNDQTQNPEKSFDVLAVSRTREGINLYLRRHWCNEDSEMRVNDDGWIAERDMYEDGWGEWEYRSPMDSPFVFALQEIPFEEDLPDE